MKTLDIFNNLSTEDAKSEKGHWRYECKICKKRYHNIGKALVKHFKQHQRKGETLMNEPKVETEEKQPLYHGKPAVDEAEFARIKELDFRGETKMDIIKISGRSFETVDRIIRAKDFTDFKETNWRSPEAKREKKKSPILTQYSRLQGIREQFDTALAEFIVTTAQNLEQTLWAENAVLRHNNEELNKQLEESNQKKTTNSFLNILQDRLIPKEPPVKKVLLPAYPDKMNRLCYLREDLVEVMAVEKLDMFVEQMKSENRAGGKAAIIEINEKEAYPVRDILNFLYEQQK